MALLAIRNLSHRYDGLLALDEVSFELEPGTITALIGPNGAGKSTLFDCVTGMVRPQRGSILFDDRAIMGLAPHRIARAGLVRTFQNLELFEALSVEQQLMVARHRFARAGLFHGLCNWGGRSFAAREDRAQAVVIEGLLKQFELWDERQRPVSELTYGTRKRVELARALATEPRLLLLDEPTAGLTAPERADLAVRLRGWVRDHGATLLFIEHHLSFVHALAERVVALASGRCLAAGHPAAVMADPLVRSSYLGELEP